MSGRRSEANETVRAFTCLTHLHLQNTHLCSTCWAPPHIYTNPTSTTWVSLFAHGRLNGFRQTDSCVLYNPRWLDSYWSTGHISAQIQTFPVSGCNDHTFLSSASLSHNSRLEEASVTFSTNFVIFRSPFRRLKGEVRPAYKKMHELSVHLEMDEGERDSEAHCRHMERRPSAALTPIIVEKAKN